MHVYAAGSPPLTYQWFFAGQPIPDATNATLTLAAVQASNATAYLIQASNQFGTSWATSTVALSSIPLADALDTPGWSWTTGGDPLAFTTTNFSVLGGSALELSWQGDYDGHAKWSSLATQVEGPATLGFWWYHTAQPESYLTSLSLSGPVSKSVPANTGWRHETVFLPAGSHNLEWDYFAYTWPPSRVQRAFLDAVSLVPGQTAPFIVQQPSPANLVVQPKVDVTLSGGADGTPPLVYQWRCNGTNLLDATSAVLSLSAVRPNQAGIYELVISNMAGSITSAPVVLDVLPAPSNVVATITSYPLSVGDSGWVSGPVAMQGSALSNYAIVTFVKVGYGGWWSKPTFSAPLTSISSNDGTNGTYSVWPFTGGIDSLCFRIAVFLIPRGWSPPLLAGSSALPETLYTHSEAHHEITRGLNQQPQIQVTRLGQDAARISIFSGQNYLYYAVQATDSLTNTSWVTIPGSTALFYSEFNFEDHLPPGTPQRFYRL
ncbi:MAG: hypothetical protein HYZ36_01540, partial [Pedosphaera parvula]|nr:hypothetical protein [Pedosphaera parvula]